MPIEGRYARQEGIVPSAKIAVCKSTVIGVGAIGRQIAMQLAAMGMPRIQLVDFDTVDASNLSSQGYWEDDLGRDKVAATAEACRRINSSVEIEPVVGRFRRDQPFGNVVFAAVDSIDTRSFIWDAVAGRYEFFGDCRMSAETLRVLSVCDSESRDHYPTTLFAADEAYTGSCTAKSTIYCANIAAGMVLSQFAKYLRGFHVEKDLSLNLFANELAC